MDDFVQMSALLTGFAAAAIAPSLDPVNLKATLFATAQQGAGSSFDALLAQYAELSGGKPVSEMTPAERQSIGDQLLGLGGVDQPADRVETAQSVIRLWYLGYWYPIDGSDPGGEVASDQAYVRGLSWKSMQSHAMGYSTWSYGYWASPAAAALRFHRPQRRRGGTGARRTEVQSMRARRPATTSSSSAPASPARCWPRSWARRASGC